MKLPNTSVKSRVVAGFAALSLLLLNGCRREETRVFNIPKETVQAENPHLHWELPEGWQEKPAEGMRAASFVVQGASDQVADVSVIPLPGVSGTHLDNVNRWRGQVGLAPISAEQLASETESVSIAGSEGSLVDFEGANPATQKPEQILAATFVASGATWFIKMTGPPALVTEQKPKFRDFLKSLTFHSAGAHSGAAQVAQDQPGSPGGTLPVGPAQPPAPTPLAAPTWEVPPAWQEVPPTSMLLAKFNVSGANDSKADITVSAFPGNTGGMFANVNRWRNQIGLGPISETELTKSTTELDVNGQQAVLVDMSNQTGAKQSDRIIAVVLPRGGHTWFFKMLGDGALIEQQKAAFIKFVQSVRFPHA